MRQRIVDAIVRLSFMFGGNVGHWLRTASARIEKQDPSITGSFKGRWRYDNGYAYRFDVPSTQSPSDIALDASIAKALGTKPPSYNPENVMRQHDARADALCSRARGAKA